MLENAKTLVTKLKGRESVQLEQVETGKELLGALEQATSRFGAIKNVVLYGHGGAGSLYLRNDAGFYQNPEGAWDDPDERMRSLGATTVGDLEERMKVDPKTGVKPIEFAPDATIVLGACNCGFGSTSISKDIAQVTGARVISAGRGAQPDRANNPANREILESRAGWKSFQKVLVNGPPEVTSEDLRKTLLDPKKYLR